MWDKDLPLVWLPQIPSCNSSRSSSTASRFMHSRYGPEKVLLYNFWSLESQNRGDFLHTLLALDLPSGKIYSLRNSTIESIQLGPTFIWWIWTLFPPLSVGLHKSSTRITRGKLCAEGVASVVRKSACVFLLLGIYDKLKDSNPDCKCLTWFKYSCILRSLASNSPWTWPTTSLESENISIAFPPIFWTMVIPTSRASLFVAEKPNLKDFSIVILSRDIRTSPTPDPLWFAAPSTYTFQVKGSCKEIAPTNFLSMFCFSTLSCNGVLANLATRSTRTWPLTEVWGIYLISKAPRIVPHLAILPV